MIKNTSAERDLTSQVGPVEIDWPRSVGYFGAVGAAVAAELVPPVLGLFIAAVPLIKMLNHPRARRGIRLVAQVFDGAAQPVGGSAEGTIRLRSAAPIIRATGRKRASKIRRTR
jgi:hypothetical protein